MKRIDKILNFLKNEYELKTDKDVAIKLGVPYNTFKNWVLRDSPNYGVLLDFAEKNDIDLNSLLGAKDTSLNSLANVPIALKNEISILNEDQQDLLTIALHEAREKSAFVSLGNHLVDFYLTSIFKSDFMVDSAQKVFWKELFFADTTKISFTLLLGKILSNFNLDTDDITETGAKKVLIDLVKNYQLKLIDERLKHGLTEVEKDNLIDWLEEELVDFDAYIILKNIPSVLRLFKKGINSCNKHAF